jgi:DNA mismatch repair protein MutS2
LLERASDILGPEGERLESLLQTLEQQRVKLSQEVIAAEFARDASQKEAEILRKQIDMLRNKEAEVIAAAAEKADELLEDTLQRAKELKRVATSNPQERSKALEELQQLRRNAQQQVQSQSKTQSGVKQTQQPQQNKNTLQPGAVVFVEDYNAAGPILELRGDEVVVQLGLLKITAPKRSVRLVKKEPVVNTSSGKTKVTAFTSSTRFESELNIRGERVEEGLEKVREFILEAKSLKTSPVRILHGKGTGTLRDAVRNYLKNDRNVERYEDAVPYEGGHGVTVAYLR